MYLLVRDKDRGLVLGSPRSWNNLGLPRTPVGTRQVPGAGWSDILGLVPAVRLIAAELIREYEGVICLLQKTTSHFVAV